MKKLMMMIVMFFAISSMVNVMAEETPSQSLEVNEFELTAEEQILISQPIEPSVSDKLEYEARKLLGLETDIVYDPILDAWFINPVMATERKKSKWWQVQIDAQRK